MNDSIPQSFKVEWLNTTLKFIKNDRQLIMKYPEMPISYVEYLHKLIWQRQNEVGFGFKSLYSPLWEAMKIFSLKYKFKVTMMKGNNEDTGQLIIEKILKNANKKCDDDNDKTEEEEDTEDNSSTQAPEESTKPKCIKRQTKSAKYLKDKCKIIDSLSPAFILRSLQKILVFVNDESEASLVFEDLAPVEAKFLENFNGIYNRRHAFEVLLSPACNDILEQICTGFKVFEKKFKLAVCRVVTNMETKKRTLTFLKEPRYVRTNLSRSQRKMLAKENPEDAQSSADEIDTPSGSSSATSMNNNPIKTPQTSNNETTDAQTDKHNNILEAKIDNKCPKTSFTIHNKNVFNISDNFMKEENYMYFNFKIDNTDNEIQIGTDNKSATHEKQIDKSNDDKSVVIENLDRIKNTNVTDDKNGNNSKIITERSSSGPSKCATDKKDTDNVHVKNDLKREDVAPKQLQDYNALKPTSIGMAHTKDVSKFLKDPNKKMKSQSGITFVQPTGSLDKLEKTQEAIQRRMDKKMEKRCLEKNKLIDAMSKPLESDKGLRMMQLMGWRGGALGRSGEGITEPIMPVLSLSAGAGLGHVSERFVRKQARVDLCTDILENILHMIERNISISVITIQDTVTKRERRLLKVIMTCVNLRLDAPPPKGVDDLLMKRVVDKMMLDPDNDIDYTLSNNNKEITLKKINQSETEPQIPKKIKKLKLSSANIQSLDTKTKMPNVKVHFKQLFLTKVLELINSDEDSMRIDFDSVMRKKYVRFVDNAVASMNRRVPVNTSTVLASTTEIIQNLGKSCLVVKYGDDMTSLTVTKTCYKNRFINSAVKTIPSGKITENESNLNELSAKIDEKESDLAKNDETLTKDSLVISDGSKEISAGNADRKTIGQNDEETIPIENMNDFDESIEPANSENTCIKSPLQNDEKVATSKENVKNKDKIEKSNLKDLCLKPVVKYRKKRNRNSEVNDKFQEEILYSKYDFMVENLNKNKNNIKSSEANILSESEKKLVSRKLSDRKLDLGLIEGSKENTNDGVNKEEVLHKRNLNVYKIQEECIDLDTCKEEKISPKSNDANNNRKDIKNKLEDVDRLDIKSSKENVQNISVEVDCVAKERKSDTNMKESLQNDQVISVAVNSQEAVDNVFKVNEFVNNDQEELVAVSVKNVDKAKSLSNSDESVKNDQDLSVQVKNVIKVLKEPVENYQDLLAEVSYEGKNDCKYSLPNIEEVHSESFNKDSNSSLNRVVTNHDKNNLSSEVTIPDLNNFNKISNEAVINEDITENRVLNNIITIVKENRNESSRHFLQAVQNVITTNIGKEFLPSLKCHGVNHRGIIYSCGNKESYLWLKEVLKDFKVIDYKEITDNKYTVQIKTNTMLDVKSVLNLLELYNVGLCCEKWVVTGEKFKDFLVFIADIDCDSFKHVCDSNFKLSIGVDEVDFCINFSS